MCVLMHLRVVGRGRGTQKEVILFLFFFFQYSIGFELFPCCWIFFERNNFISQDYLSISM